MRWPSVDRVIGHAVLFVSAALIGRTIRWYPLLPEQIPIHFGGDGRPDRWVSAHWVVWLLLPLMALALSITIMYLAKWVPKLAEGSPASVNVPDKNRFVQLSPPARMQVLLPTATYLRWVGLLLILLFTYIVEGTARVAVGQMDKLPLWPVLLFLAGVLGALPLMIRATKRAISMSWEQEHVAP